MTLDEVEKLAGPLRCKSFRAAAERIIALKMKALIETGCYRGGPQDGESTKILAALAKENGGALDSYELNVEHIKLAVAHVKDSTVCFHLGDSAAELAKRTVPIDFAYLDSRDYEESNPQPSQMHQLAEVYAIADKMSRPGLILVDDCKLPYGGKNGLSHPFLIERGWKMVFDDYQRLYANYQ